MSECRICAATDAIFLNIFQKNDARKYDVEINTCLPIKVTTDDVISLRICHICVHKLELCNAFVCHFLATEPQRQRDCGQNLCYLCLKNDGILSSLFDGNFNWIHQIETALGCKVLRGKRVPSKICHHCAYKLGELYNLFQSALDSESKLYMMCEFPKANNQNQKLVMKDTKDLKSSVKVSKQLTPTKSSGSINNAIIRVATRKVNSTEVRNDLSAGVQSDANTNVVRVAVAKISSGGVGGVAARHPDGSDVKGKDKQLGIPSQMLEGRGTRKNSAPMKIQEEPKHKALTKGSKATLKPVDNINVACWKCYRNVKNNETCSCSVNVDCSTKAKKAEQKNGVHITVKDVTAGKTESTIKGAGGRNKRKIETEDLSSKNTKKVRGDAKKAILKKRDVIPVGSHLYDIRRTKRKRTITDYNQLLNDGLLLSPRVDRGKKEVKSVPKVTPSKEAAKTPVSVKQIPVVSSKRNSQKSSDAKLENQENIPQKNKMSETSKRKRERVHIVVDGRKSAKALKSSSKSRVPNKLPQGEVGTAEISEEMPAPPEKLNKYECSVCNTQFPSTVEGKLHEVTHTARIMKLIMYRWADRSSNQNSPSKQSQKNARRAESAENDLDSKIVTKEIKKMLQDVVSKVSEESSSKVQNVNGHNVTRTRTGRIVVSKVHITKITGKKRGRKSNAEVSKNAETVRNIISDFESLEEGDELATEPSLTTEVEQSGGPATDTVEVDECVRTGSEKESKQKRGAAKATNSKPLEKQTEQNAVEVNSESQAKAVSSDSYGCNEEEETESTTLTSQDSREDQDGKAEELCSPVTTDVSSNQQLVAREPGEGMHSGEVGSNQTEDTDVGSASKDEKELDSVVTGGDKILPQVQTEDDVIDVEDKTPGSSGSSVIVEELTAPSNGMHHGGSSYDMHTSLEKEIYELHGVDNSELTPPKIADVVDSVSTHGSSDSDKVSSPVSNETDLIQILE